MNYLTEPLNTNHDRSAFSCGKTSLDNYIKKQASQDMKRRLSVVFVMTANDQNNKVIGYYTLASEGINKDIVPDAIKRKMPPTYHQLPVTLLGRLAVDYRYQGKKAGQRLLIDALKRSAAISKTELGSMAVVVDPIDAEATLFYQQYGFIQLPDRERMFLPMKTIEALFN